jgi:hypothetical protein
MGQDSIDRAEVNRLYWWSEEPVARIADQLDVSRRALYDIVEPLGTGAPCPSCGTELNFANRSARQHGDAVCPGCGVQSYVDPDGDRARAEEMRYGTGDGRTPAARMEPSGDGRSDDGPSLDFEEVRLDEVRGDGLREDRVPDAREADLRHRAAVLSGAAIACVALGTVATLLARRKS